MGLAPGAEGHKGADTQRRSRRHDGAHHQKLEEHGRLAVKAAEAQPLPHKAQQQKGAQPHEHQQQIPGDAVEPVQGDALPPPAVAAAPAQVDRQHQPRAGAQQRLRKARAPRRLPLVERLVGPQVAVVHRHVPVQPQRQLQPLGAPVCLPVGERPPIEALGPGGNRPGGVSVAHRAGAGAGLPAQVGSGGVKALLQGGLGLAQIGGELLPQIPGVVILQKLLEPRAVELLEVLHRVPFPRPGVVPGILSPEDVVVHQLIPAHDGGGGKADHRHHEGQGLHGRVFSPLHPIFSIL